MLTSRKFNYERMTCDQLFYGCLDAKDMDLVETARWLEACACSGFCGSHHQDDAFYGSSNQIATWVSSLADTIMFRALKEKSCDPNRPDFNAQRFTNTQQAFNAWFHEVARPNGIPKKDPTPFLEWMAAHPSVSCV